MMNPIAMGPAIQTRQDVRFGNQPARIIPYQEFSGNDHSGEIVRFVDSLKNQRMDLFQRTEPVVAVIDNEADFQKALTFVSRNLGALPHQAPTANFDRQAVVLVLDPPSIGGSPQPLLDKMTYDGRQLKIALTYLRSDEHFFTEEMGNPFYMAVVDKDKVKNEPLVGS